MTKFRVNCKVRLRYKEGGLPHPVGTHDNAVLSLQGCSYKGVQISRGLKQTSKRQGTAYFFSCNSYTVVIVNTM